MQTYLDALSELVDAPARPDRTGTGTRSVFGYAMRFDDPHPPIKAPVAV